MRSENAMAAIFHTRWSHLVGSFRTTKQLLAKQKSRKNNFGVYFRKFKFQEFSFHTTSHLM